MITDSQGRIIAPDAKNVYPLPVASSPAFFFFTVSAPPGASPADYTVTASLDANATGWGNNPVALVDPPDGKLLAFQGQRQIEISVAPQGGASDTNVTVRVSRNSDPTATFGHKTLAIRAA